jgi:ribosomal-protein-alanine N-acetyltransferase
VTRTGKAAEFLIRNSSEVEFEPLWAIDQACFDRAFAYSRDELRFYMRLPGAFSLVAELERKPIGFVVARALRNLKGHIITIDVLSEARRQGVGSLLLEAAERRLSEHRCDNVTLETAVDNAGAIAFYHRHGFHILRTLRGYYSNGVDALEMRKTLGPHTSGPAH